MKRLFFAQHIIALGDRFKRRPNVTEKRTS